MEGKGNRIRTVTVPAGVKSRIDQWLEAAGITEGRLFRPVNKGDVLAGEEIRDGESHLASWSCATRKRRSWAGLHPTIYAVLAPNSAGRPVGNWNRYSLLLGHATIQTTERYLGTEQALAHAVNDAIGLDLE